MMTGRAIGSVAQRTERQLIWRSQVRILPDPFCAFRTPLVVLNVYVTGVFLNLDGLLVAVRGTWGLS